LYTKDAYKNSKRNLSSLTNKNTDDTNEKYEKIINNIKSKIQKRSQTVTQRISHEKNNSFSLNAQSNLSNRKSHFSLKQNPHNFIRCRNNLNFRSFSYVGSQDLKSVSKRSIQNSSKFRTHKIRRYQKTADNLITKCKHEESLYQSPIKDKDDFKKKNEHDKRSASIGWAVKEYINGITERKLDEVKNIDFLIEHKNINQNFKKSLVNDYLIDNIRENMMKRLLVIKYYEKRRIWKPSKYIPPRNLVLANSIAELENLYKI